VSLNTEYSPRGHTPSGDGVCDRAASIRLSCVRSIGLVDNPESLPMSPLIVLTRFRLGTSHRPTPISSDFKIRPHVDDEAAAGVEENGTIEDWKLPVCSRNARIYIFTTPPRRRPSVWSCVYNTICHSLSVPRLLWTPLMGLLQLRFCIVGLVFIVNTISTISFMMYMYVYVCTDPISNRMLAYGICGSVNGIAVWGQVRFLMLLTALRET